jgi:hypothetical protein
MLLLSRLPRYLITCSMTTTRKDFRFHSAVRCHGMALKCNRAQQIAPLPKPNIINCVCYTIASMYVSSRPDRNF